MKDLIVGGLFFGINSQQNKS